MRPRGDEDEVGPKGPIRAGGLGRCVGVHY